MKIISLSLCAFAALIMSYCCNAGVIPTQLSISYDSIPNLILHFNAKKDFQRILLEWATAAETDSRYFSVERSANGLSWTACARLDAAGTSDSLSEYETIDYSPIASQNLYRLKQVNWDGSARYSNIVKVDFSEQISLDIYPNPATDFINVEWLEETPGLAIIEIYNVSGKRVKYLTSQSNETKVLLGKMPSGLYFVRVQKNGQFFSEKFLVR